VDGFVPPFLSPSIFAVNLICVQQSRCRMPGVDSHRQANQVFISFNIELSSFQNSGGKTSKIGGFGPPILGGGDTPIFGRAFSNGTHFRA